MDAGIISNPTDKNHVMMSTVKEKPKKWTRAKAPRVRTGCKTWYTKQTIVFPIT
ncbi:hypothetical protein BGZ61DRAFT_464947 [Ilyonectria robusta]|uniref:uncharacterized protein n=1 Tax=Ilyonectria robusta TaxID=1079257 RepID=UPI001E8CE034|nr:uncharacterized protein BGZ61DRAFT_464947 [Ilyonectria robusta]KAH8659702.1 hypothetical protein BGZ61DRAFT_464947 [Ilyonectria robusta]